MNFIYETIKAHSYISPFKGIQDVLILRLYYLEVKKGAKKMAVIFFNEVQRPGDHRRGK